MSIPTTLRTAADQIERRGWTTGPGGWPYPNKIETPLCIEGAIMAAIGLAGDEEPELHEVIQCPAYRAVVKYLELDEEQGERLFDWNDALPNDRSSSPGLRNQESKAKVIGVLRDAADAAERGVIG